MTSGARAVSMDFTLIVELTFMTDPKLEEEIALVGRCMEMLKHFHDIFDSAILSETVVPEDEGKIQRLREALPSQWDSLFRKLQLRDDESVETLVKMASSLPTVITMTEYQVRKLYALWHKSFMKLHSLLGKLQHRKEMLQAFRSGKAKAKKLLLAPVVLIIVGLVALLLYIVLR